MFASGLYATGRYRPDFLFQIELIPQCACDFARSGGGQNQELESINPHTVLFLEALQELTDFVIG